MVTADPRPPKYHHPRLGFSLSVPPGWELIEDLSEGVGLVAVEPTAAAGFRANAVVTVDQLSVGTDLEAWQQTVAEQLVQQLPHFHLLDHENLRRDGRDFVRRLGHHIGDNTGPVTMEQWATIAGNTGYTLTVSVATLSYDSLADVFADMAQSLRTLQEQT